MNDQAGNILGLILTGVIIVAVYKFLVNNITLPVIVTCKSNSHSDEYLNNCGHEETAKAVRRILDKVGIVAFYNTTGIPVDETWSIYAIRYYVDWKIEKVGTIPKPIDVKIMIPQELDEFVAYGRLRCIKEEI